MRRRIENHQEIREIRYLEQDRKRHEEYEENYNFARFSELGRSWNPFEGIEYVDDLECNRETRILETRMHAIRATVMRLMRVVSRCTLEG